MSVIMSETKPGVMFVLIWVKMIRYSDVPIYASWVHELSHYWYSHLLLQPDAFVPCSRLGMSDKSDFYLMSRTAYICHPEATPTSCCDSSSATPTQHPSAVVTAPQLHPPTVATALPTGASPLPTPP